MGIFNIKLTPKVKDRDWEIKHLYSSRRPKVCEACGKPVGSSDPNTSFTKRTSVGAKTNYETVYTHGHDRHPCTIAIKEKLGL